MSSKTPTIGGTIQVRCEKCRKTTNHTIVAMGEEHPTEVRCDKCKHLSAPKKTVARRSTDPKKSEQDEWTALRPDMDSARARDYSMTESYKAKSLVNHPVFGLGLVQRQAGPQKMAVLFADGEKIMRCQ